MLIARIDKTTPHLVPPRPSTHLAPSSYSRSYPVGVAKPYLFFLLTMVGKKWSGLDSTWVLRNFQVILKAVNTIYSF